MKVSESKVLKIKGLQCDDCDYIDETIKPDDYENLIGTPCPKCGACLLIQADFDTFQEMLKIEEMLNSIGIPLVAQTGEQTFKARIKMDGSGKAELMDIEIV